MLHVAEVHTVQEFFCLGFGLFLRAGFGLVFFVVCVLESSCVAVSVKERFAVMRLVRHTTTYESALQTPSGDGGAFGISIGLILPLGQSHVLQAWSAPPGAADRGGA
jgi:hypothetical protein